MQPDDATTSAQRVDRRQFHIVRCLGRGGFGEVYQATMESAGGVRTNVAVKVLHQGLDPRSQAVQRLRDEGRLLGILNHPSILRVTDLVILEGRIALVTEYVEGADLDYCIRVEKEPIGPRALVEVCGRVADALNAAYYTLSPEGEKLALIHRDIKPSNVRLGKHGDVKVLDFGIAKAAGIKREAKTQARAVIGSYLYMAPERFDEDRASLSSDVYALGCTLFDGLAHEHLFGDVALKKQYLLALNQQKYEQYLNERFDKLREFPEEVIHLVASMLAYDPALRPQPQDLSQACDELAENIEGPTLRRWAKTFPWPEPDATDGDLDGMVITETTLTGSPASSTPRPVSRSLGAEPSLVKPAAESDDKGTFAFERPNLPRTTPVSPLTPDTLAAAKHLEEVKEEVESGRSKGLIIAVAGIGLVVVFLAILGIGGGTLAILSLGSGTGEGAVVADADGTEGTDEAAGTDKPDTGKEADPKVGAEAGPATPAETSPEGTPGTAEGTDVPAGTETPPESPASTPPGTTTPPATTPPATTTAKPPKTTTTTAPKPPEPTPVVETPPPPPPKPKASTAPGIVVVQGSAKVELRGGSATYVPGEVPSGDYEIWSDFGSGYERAGKIRVDSGQTVTIKCSRLRADCVQVL